MLTRVRMWARTFSLQSADLPTRPAEREVPRASAIDRGRLASLLIRSWGQGSVAPAPPRGHYSWTSHRQPRTRPCSCHLDASVVAASLSLLWAKAEPSARTEMD